MNKIVIGDLNIHLIEELDHKIDNSCYWPEDIERILLLVNDLWRELNPNILLFSYLKGNVTSRIDYVLIDPNINMEFTPFFAPFDPLISADHRIVGTWINKNEKADRRNENFEFVTNDRIDIKKFKDNNTQLLFENETAFIHNVEIISNNQSSEDLVKFFSVFFFSLYR